MVMRMRGSEGSWGHSPLKKSGVTPSDPLLIQPGIWRGFTTKNLVVEGVGRVRGVVA
jgi:hypothetical protein